MHEATFAAFEDELEKIAVTMATASPRLRHAFARLKSWKEFGTLGASRHAKPGRVGAVKSIEESAAAMPKTMRKTMLEKARHVEKHFGAPHRSPGLKGKSVMFAKPEPSKARNLPR
jgi:hypothetical protein